MKVFDITKVPFTSVLQPIEDIEERNQKFDSLSKKEKRREIAYDQLCLIANSVVSQSYGDYWNENIHYHIDKCETSKDLQLKLQNIPQCKVCARGGIMLSQIRLGNKVNPDDSSKQYGAYHNLDGFSYEQMRKMENVYEGSQLHSKLMLFPYRFNTVENLINIYLNVIVNGNYIFKPTDYINKLGITINK